MLRPRGPLFVQLFFLSLLSSSYCTRYCASFLAVSKGTVVNMVMIVADGDGKIPKIAFEVINCPVRVSRCS